MKEGRGILARMPWASLSNVRACSHVPAEGPILSMIPDIASRS
jgi:hypothetical protein